VNVTAVFTPELALVLTTIVGLAFTAVAIARDVGPRRIVTSGMTEASRVRPRGAATTTS
jgi:hypothetical protein